MLRLSLILLCSLSTFSLFAVEAFECKDPAGRGITVTHSTITIHDPVLVGNIAQHAEVKGGFDLLRTRFKTLVFHISDSGERTRVHSLRQSPKDFRLVSALAEHSLDFTTSEGKTLQHEVWGGPSGANGGAKFSVESAEVVNSRDQKTSVLLLNLSVPRAQLDFSWRLYGKTTACKKLADNP